MPGQARAGSSPGRGSAGDQARPADADAAARRQARGDAAARRRRAAHQRGRRARRHLPARRPLEGEANKSVEASGKVELRTRRETVLADWLHYDFDRRTRSGPRATSRCASGSTGSAGPELKFQREREIGYFDEPRFFIRRNRRHGEANEIRFAGPTTYEASKAQYTTCVAPNNDWYLRADEIEVDKLRKVGTAHDASVYFLDVPVMYTPWLEFPLSERAQVRLPHADDRVDADPRLRIRRAVLLQPRAQLRRDGDAADHDPARAP